jgi:curved DNA-binding protein CbpA
MMDPFRLLGVSPASDDETIRLAYLAAVRACPPERDRQRFEQVRIAYESIATPRARMSLALFDTRAPTPEDLVAELLATFQPKMPTDQRLRSALLNKQGGK